MTTPSLQLSPALRTVPRLSLRRLLGLGLASGLLIWAVLLLTTGTRSHGLPGYTGPAGLGDAASNVIWLDLSPGSAPDGAAYDTWTDISGNGHDATQSGHRRPIFRSAPGFALHGRPVLHFDGSQHFYPIANHPDLNTGGPYEAKTIALVFRTGPDVQRQQFLFEEGGNVRGLNMYLEGGNLYFGAYNIVRDDATTPWPFTYLLTPVQASTAYIALLTFDFAHDAFSGYLNGQLVGTASGIGRLHPHPDKIGLGGVNQMSYDHRGVVTQRCPFGGEIAEFIGYNAVLNAAGRDILTNSLAAKFGFSIPFDYYTWEATHSHEVAGLGQIGSEKETDAAGTGILRIHSPADLDPGEFLLWGHDGTDILRGNTQDVDGQQIRSRLARTWRVAETGQVGPVTLVFDLTAHSGLIPADVRLLIERNGDQFVTLEAPPQPGTYDPATHTLTFTGVSLAHGDLITLGSTSTQFPVELLSFEAIPGARTVALRWTTASELNNAYFDLERAGADYDFVPLERVPGAGTTLRLTAYRALDDRPLAGQAYYRLRQVDYDGEYVYSPVVAVFSTPAATGLEIFPNPAAAGRPVAVRYQSEPPAGLQVRDATGQLVYQDQLPGGPQVQEVQIPTGEWARGVYIVQLLPHRGSLRSERLIVR